jgi:hypothetical protein
MRRRSGQQLRDSPSRLALTELVHGRALQEPIRHLLGIKADRARNANGRHPAGRSESINVLWGDFEVITQVLRRRTGLSLQTFKLNSCAGILARKLA